MMIYIYDVRTLFESVGCTNYPRVGVSSWRNDYALYASIYILYKPDDFEKSFARLRVVTEHKTLVKNAENI